MFDRKKLAAALDQNALSRSRDKCAEYVDKALEGAGLDTAHHPRYAKDYGNYLLSLGFHQISSNGPFEEGDVAVIQPDAEAMHDHLSSAGHVTAYDGSQWISDFRQRDIWGGPYRRDHPPIKVYRHD